MSIVILNNQVGMLVGTNETSGTTLYDYSGNARNLTLTNSPVIQMSKSGKMQVVYSKTGQKFATAATNVGWTSTTAGSWCGWVKFNIANNGLDNNFFSLQDATTDSRFFFGLYLSGSTYTFRNYKTTNGGISDNVLVFNVLAPLNSQWIHVALTYTTAGLLSVYINGVLAASQAGTTIGGNDGYTNGFWLSAVIGNTENLEGIMYSPIFFNRAITNAELKDIMRKTFIQ
jgi:hypothetical protein